MQRLAHTSPNRTSSERKEVMGATPSSNPCSLPLTARSCTLINNVAGQEGDERKARLVAQR